MASWTNESEVERGVRYSACDDDNDGIIFVSGLRLLPSVCTEVLWD